MCEEQPKQHLGGMVQDHHRFGLKIPAPLLGAGRSRPLDLDTLDRPLRGVGGGELMFIAQHQREDFYTHGDELTGYLLVEGEVEFLELLPRERTARRRHTL